MSNIRDPNGSENDSKDQAQDSESIVSHIIISKDNSGGIQVSLSSQACAASAVESASSFDGTTSDSSFRATEDSKGVSIIKCKKGKKKSKKDNQDIKLRDIPAEGQHHIGGEKGIGADTLISSEFATQECRCEVNSLATASSLPNAMERADISPYTSDEWEEASSNSETDEDHSDSSDDDDPKSQVDKLIEQGTQLLLDGENSGLSSEDDDSDFDDSESDITDVSPIISATASPLGLSPVLPRKNVATSPLAFHNNGELQFDFLRRSLSQSDIERYIVPETDNATEDHSLDMDQLMQMILQLDIDNLQNPENINECGKKNKKTTGLRHRKSYHEAMKEENLYFDPILDNPHHQHLRKTSGSLHGRKNMSFSNEEVRKIDRENKILLKKIMAAHSRGVLNTHRYNIHMQQQQQQQHQPSEFVHTPYPRPSTSPNNRSHSLIARKREEEKIRKDNVIILKKIQDAKPSKEIMERRTYSGSSYNPHHHHHSSSHRNSSNRGMRNTTSASCAASMRRMTSPHHVMVPPPPPPHKETAL